MMMMKRTKKLLREKGSWITNDAYVQAVVVAADPMRIMRKLMMTMQLIDVVDTSKVISCNKISV